MKKANRTKSQVIGMLHEHEAGAKCADICRKRGLSEGNRRAKTSVTNVT